MTTYRVTYPLITQDGFRDFDNRDEAEAFARNKRDDVGRFQTREAWRRVIVTSVVTLKDVVDTTKIEQAISDLDNLLNK